MGNHKEAQDLKKQKKKKNKTMNKNPKLFENDERVNKAEEENEKSRLAEKKKRKRQKGNDADAGKALQISIEDEKSKSTEKKKRKREKGNNVDAGKALQISIEDNSDKATREKKRNKSRKKKRKSEEQSNDVGKFDQTNNNAEDGHDEQNDDGEADQSLFETQGEIKNSKGHGGADNGNKIRTRKSKKAKKKKKKEHDTLNEGERLSDRRDEADLDEVYHISSGDEDCSKGMKKWITEYHQSRPGLKVLQQRIDEFIIAHEANLEQERKEKEARAAEGGWTVVTHQKGRKKTTDSESGITVGSVAQAAVDDNMAKKKRKEVGLDFYRFQRREAQRNEILSLQSKFEQDKKRIQQLRAARKFRPY